MTTPPAVQPPLRPASISPEPADVSIAPAKQNSLLPLWIGLGVFAVLAAAGVFAYNYYFHASITPTKLSEREMVALNEKIKVVEEASQDSPGVRVETGEVKVLPPVANDPAVPSAPAAPPVAAPEPRDIRTLVLTQRELNGILNNNTEFGQYVKVDLKPGYFDITTIVPVDQEVPFLGGKTLRTSVDFTLKKSEGGELVLAVRDVSVAGVPLPAAWLEGAGVMKGENLLKDLKSQYPWFERFVAGIERVEIGSGELKVKLAE
jgi:hypothetical protein